MRLQTTQSYIRAAALTGVLIAGPATGVVNAQTPSPGASSCAALVGMQVQSGSVTATQYIARGQTVDLGTTASVDFCRVSLVLQPTTSSDINVDVWMPDTWNEKLFSYGGGGFSGGLGQSDQPMDAGIGQGYVAATSDLGHATSATVQWAWYEPQKVIDFGYRADHLVAVTAKQLTNTYYGSSVEHASMPVRPRVVAVPEQRQRHYILSDTD